MFHYDWFHGEPFHQQQEEAKRRCVLAHFPELDVDEIFEREECQQFSEELEVRCLLYLRDGFSYELKEIIEPRSKSALTFECEPVDEQYKVGSFVVVLPFEEILRVEVYAVHPSEKPSEMPQITGFRSPGEGVEQPAKQPGERKGS